MEKNGGRLKSDKGLVVNPVLSNFRFRNYSKRGDKRVQQLDIVSLHGHRSAYRGTMPDAGRG